MIRVSGLCKEFAGRPVLRDVGFVAAPGQIVGYLGPNGAGKSTTLKIITGLLRATSGEVWIAEHEISRSPLEAKRHIGYVPENAALYESLTPNEYLSLVAELHSLDRESAQRRIARFLELFDLTPAADISIDQLSKGMRQKVLILGAVLHDPDVLVLDEPLNGLDVKSSLAFRSVLEEMAERGKTILFSSHILDVVQRVCCRIVVLHEGRIVADDSTEDLLGGARSGSLEAVFRSVTGADDVETWARSFVEALREDTGSREARSPESGDGG